MDLFSELTRRGKLLIDELVRLEHTALTEPTRRAHVMARLEARLEAYRGVLHDVLLPLFLESDATRARIIKASALDDEITERLGDLRILRFDDVQFEPRFRILAMVIRDLIETIQDDLSPVARKMIGDERARELYQFMFAL